MNFRANSWLAKEALLVIVKHMDIQNIKELQQAFLTLDFNRRGTLTFDELRKGLEMVGITAASDTVSLILENVNINGDGEISYHEFLTATFAKKIELSEA
jgi:calcium-dependent protein kinase